MRASGGARRVKLDDVDVKFVEDVRSRIRLPDRMEDVQFFESAGTTMAVIVVPGDDGPKRVDVLGCPACILPSSYHRTERGILVGGRIAPPLSSVCEDDSRNPAMDAFVICPFCGRPLIDPERLRRGVVGFVRGD